MTENPKKQVPASKRFGVPGKECDICHCKFTEWGNNPAPFIGEICCDECNTNLVVPARIYISMKRRR